MFGVELGATGCTDEEVVGCHGHVYDTIIILCFSMTCLFTRGGGCECECR